MKKSLIALAVLASTGAMAQSSVTLYGIVDVNLQSKKTDSITKQALESGGVSGSRFGFKGTEDLGGGLKANFVLESGFTIDDGKGSTSGLFNRQSYVGLSGGFGEIQLGNAYSALDDIHGSVNAVFDSILSPTAGSTATKSFQAGYVSNPKNNIKYLSPSFAGFTGTVSYALGEDKAAATTTTAAVKAHDVVSLNAQYANGPVYVGYGFQSDKKNVTAGVATKHNLVNASYDLGVVKLLASYRNTKNTDLGDEKENVAQIGVDVPVGANLVVSTGFASAVAKNAGVADRKGNAFALGASYSLSKRTSVYTGFNLTEIKQASDKEKSNLYAVGIRHAF
jgi:predicted porin